MDTPQFVKELNGEFSESVARNFAKNFALNQINQYAYEYSVHAKSRYLRGQSFYVDSAGDKQIWGRYRVIGGLKGAAQQLFGGLIHYPLSLAGTHQFKMKGAWREQSIRSMEDRMQGATMEESMGRNSMWWGRYAMMAGGLGLMSILFNVNLFNIVDLDTANRLRQAHNMLYTQNFSDNPEDFQRHFGLLSLASGPTASHISYLMNVGGLLNLEDSQIQQTIFGNVDYNDPRNKDYKIYQMSTFLGHAKNKYIPAMTGGDGFQNVRHILKMYPSGWTQSGNEKLFSQGKKTQYSIKNEKKINQQALDILRQMS